MSLVTAVPAPPTVPEGYAQDGSYITVAGRNLNAKLLASRGEMQYTKALIGSGIMSPDQYPEIMTDVVAYAMDGHIASIDNPQDGEATVTIQASSLAVQQGFWATNIMLFALDPDLGEIAHTYLSIARHPEWIRPRGGSVEKFSEFELITIVESVPVVTAEINPNALVKKPDLDKKADRVHTHVIGDIEGLGDFAQQTSDAIDLIMLLLTNSIPGGVDYVVSFETLDNIEILDGVWEPEHRQVWA